MLLSILIQLERRTHQRKKEKFLSLSFVHSDHFASIEVQCE